MLAFPVLPLGPGPHARSVCPPDSNGCGPVAVVCDRGACRNRTISLPQVSGRSQRLTCAIVTTYMHRRDDYVHGGNGCIAPSTWNRDGLPAPSATQFPLHFCILPQRIFAEARPVYTRRDQDENRRRIPGPRPGIGPRPHRPWPSNRSHSCSRTGGVEGGAAERSGKETRPAPPRSPSRGVRRGAASAAPRAASSRNSTAIPDGGSTGADVGGIAPARRRLRAPVTFVVACARRLSESPLSFVNPMFRQRVGSSHQFSITMKPAENPGPRLDISQRPPTPCSRACSSTKSTVAPDMFP